MATLNIISFDVPFPANYGGVIDVFYKLRALHKAGVKIILHCFEYGRGEQKELNKYCEKVYYYKRNTSLFLHFSEMPYIVASRRSDELLQHLKENDHPILFEGLHTCYLLSHPDLKNRFRIFRESNIEHEYYHHLAGAEKNLLKRIYFRREAKKLQIFEKTVSSASLMLIVSKEDQKYFQKSYPGVAVEYLPSFHPNDEVISQKGKGEYVLYHGNLSVAENVVAAEYLIKEVFPKIGCRAIVAGLNPSMALKHLASQHSNIEVIANPSEEQMKELVSGAHINCLFTHQATGLKLKLLNVLYQGRFCICNDDMLHGTGLDEACIRANNTTELIASIREYMQKDFSDKAILRRKQLLAVYYDNQHKTEKLISFIS